MAVANWPYTYATTNTTLTYSPSLTGSGYSAPLVIASGGAGSVGVSPAPRTPTALEWLDSEIEATCKLARAAG